MTDIRTRPDTEATATASVTPTRSDRLRTFLAVGEAMIEMSGGGSDGQYRMGFAGDTMNTAWYARRLLGHDWTVGYVTRLGIDRYSLAMRRFFEENGLDTTHVGTVADRQPGLYFIHQQDGDRHFTYWRETSAAKLLAADPEALATAFHAAHTIYFSGITLAILSPEHRAVLLEALRTARRQGSTIAFDPNIRPKLWPGEEAIRDAIRSAASVSDIAFPTFSDDQVLFQDATIADTAGRYADLGVRETIVKNGADPAFALTPEGTATVAPQPGTTLVDATGAGDSFNAGYLASRIGGADIKEAMTQAHRVASICIAHHGALAPQDALSR
jgi:2-dehydro-3-deoxygluconokinase